MALELEELKREQAGYEQQIQAVDEAMKALQEQISAMTTEVAANKVRICRSFMQDLLHAAPIERTWKWLIN